MALEVYTLAYVEIDGLLLLEEADVTINRDARSQEQNTVAKQYAGESPGAGLVTIEVMNAVPAGGFELNPDKYFADGPKQCQIKIVAAGSTLTTDGFILGDNFRHGVNKEASIQFHGRFQMAKWLPL